jgi:hypothetical protein
MNLMESLTFSNTQDTNYHQELIYALMANIRILITYSCPLHVLNQQLSTTRATIPTFPTPSLQAWDISFPGLTTGVEVKVT